MNRLKQYGVVLAAGVVIAVGVTLLSPWASQAPDGLEKVAEDQAFIERATEPRFNLIRDYRFPGIEDERLATVLAGVTGVLAIVVITVGGGMLLARRGGASSESGPRAKG